MGYQRKLYKLTFADPEFEGLEIITRPMSMEVAISLQGSLPKDVSNPTPEEIRASFEPFVKSVIGWNLEDYEGNPLPKTVEALMTLDVPFVNTVVTTWMTEVMGIDENLGQTSNPSEIMESLPMEAL